MHFTAQIETAGALAKDFDYIYLGFEGKSVHFFLSCGLLKVANVDGLIVAHGGKCIKSLSIRCLRYCFVMFALHGLEVQFIFEC